jgi:hypothetical protein
MKAKEKVKGYKGFDKNLSCRGFQYEIGKEYEHKGAVVLCNSGFHLCEHPLDVFTHYAPSESRFCKVEGSGKMSRSDSSTKVAASKIKIVAELSIRDIVEAAVKLVFERTTKKEKSDGDKSAASVTGDNGAASASGRQCAAVATGDDGAASATGIFGAAVATGDSGAAVVVDGCQGAAVATGYGGAASADGCQCAAVATCECGAAVATGFQCAAVSTDDFGAAVVDGCQGAAVVAGDFGAAVSDGNHSIAVANGTNSVAVATGYQAIALGSGFDSRAKASMGNWIVLSEWSFDPDISMYKRVNVSTRQVDGEVIKADTYYTLKNGEFVEA